MIWTSKWRWPSTRLAASRTVAKASGIRSSSVSPPASRVRNSSVIARSSSSLMATKSSSMALTAFAIPSSWRRILPSPMRRILSMMAGTKSGSWFEARSVGRCTSRVHAGHGVRGNSTQRYPPRLPHRRIAPVGPPPTGYTSTCPGRPLSCRPKEHLMTLTSRLRARPRRRHRDHPRGHRRPARPLRRPGRRAAPGTDPGCRPAARRQRLLLPPDASAPVPRRARAGHLREPGQELVDAVAGARRRRLLRLRAQLRRDQRRLRHRARSSARPRSSTPS